MSYKVDNAIILAAGLSSRFAPLSLEKPKALFPVKGEVLIERQINQLRQSKIDNIIIVTGYQSGKFEYLKDKYNVELIYNSEYINRNNLYSLYLVKDYLKNSYICSADNYFINNPFEDTVDESYYSAIYFHGPTKEWCIKYDENLYITDVTIGGVDSWAMLGHVFFSEVFSNKFKEILNLEVKRKSNDKKMWEEIYIKHITDLRMKIKKYTEGDIYEFDSLDELRLFDTSYVSDSQSSILKNICKKLNCSEEQIENFFPLKSMNVIDGIEFTYQKKKYNYKYASESLEEE